MATTTTSDPMAWLDKLIHRAIADINVHNKTTSPNEGLVVVGIKHTTDDPIRWKFTARDKETNLVHELTMVISPFEGCAFVSNNYNRIGNKYPMQFGPGTDYAD